MMKNKKIFISIKDISRILKERKKLRLSIPETFSKDIYDNDRYSFNDKWKNKYLRIKYVLLFQEKNKFISQLFYKNYDYKFFHKDTFDYMKRLGFFQVLNFIRRFILRKFFSFKINPFIFDIKTNNIYYYKKLELLTSQMSSGKTKNSNSNILPYKYRKSIIFQITTNIFNLFKKIFFSAFNPLFIFVFFFIIFFILRKNNFITDKIDSVKVLIYFFNNIKDITKLKKIFIDYDINTRCEKKLIPFYNSSIRKIDNFISNLNNLTLDDLKDIFILNYKDQNYNKETIHFIKDDISRKLLNEELKYFLENSSNEEMLDFLNYRQTILKNNLNSAESNDSNSFITKFVNRVLKFMLIILENFQIFFKQLTALEKLSKEYKNEIFKKDEKTSFKLRSIIFLNLITVNPDKILMLLLIILIYCMEQSTFGFFNSSNNEKTEILKIKNFIIPAKSYNALDNSIIDEFIVASLSYKMNDKKLYLYEFLKTLFLQICLFIYLNYNIILKLFIFIIFFIFSCLIKEIKRILIINSARRRAKILYFVQFKDINFNLYTLNSYKGNTIHIIYRTFYSIFHFIFEKLLDIVIFPIIKAAHFIIFYSISVISIFVKNNLWFALKNIFLKNLYFFFIPLLCITSFWGILIIVFIFSDVSIRFSSIKEDKLIESLLTNILVLFSLFAIFTSCLMVVSVVHFILCLIYILLIILIGKKTIEYIDNWNSIQLYNFI